MPDATPTRDLWEHYQQAFDYFNLRLFEGALPSCILNFSAQGNSLGYFTPARWQQGEEATFHEISLNPSLLQRPGEQVMAMLVRVMVSLWQQEFGVPSRAGYYNQEWAAKMEAIGLIPSDTGQPGGRKIGQKLWHYIASDGRFASVLREIPADYFPYKGTKAPKPPPKTKPVKYVCPVCGYATRGNAGGKLKCYTDHCDAFMEAEPPL